MRTPHSTDVVFLLLLLRAVMACMSIHPGGKSCGRDRTRFECLLSMTLLLGAFEWEAEPLRVGAAASDRRAAFAYGGKA